MKNGKVSATPKVPNITASKKFSPKEGPGDNMPEMRNMKRGAQYTAGSGGTKGLGTLSIKPQGKETTAMGGSNSTHAPSGSNSPRGSVPTGEHYQASHRAPTSHSEFHKLGSGHWKP